ncbi:hypothetical protein [Bacteriovorax sp. Seq25_V]|uniref:hypothetical protein n=1 Tax=Bacteriovorax sp. Seq25_V TaxID=1201288 RepID=UPI000389E043|nr:hypothetical protein [Bacteriovorax sp. Seq25_V]EQC46035.1 hypothetical protein M900_1550 [Bacteriovorax sp. Seq25_V]
MDLANLDLDGGSSSSSEENLQGDFGGDHQPEMVEAPLHNKTEDLHLYFEQSFKNRVGTTGIFILATFAIAIVMTTALLMFSYTGPGREFLQGLKILIY